MIDDDARAFLDDLAQIAPIFTARPEPDGTDYIRPKAWQHTPTEGNADRIAAWRPGMSLQGLMGGVVAGVDVDTKNGADPDKVRQLLDGLGVTVYAEVLTPSGGWHFYVAGHPDLPSVGANAERDGLVGYPGVEIASYGSNLFLPGTKRAKYDGAGYVVVSNNLAALAEGGDPLEAEVFAGWVADNRTAAAVPAGPVADPWDGTPPDKRQQAYLDAVVHNAAKRVEEARKGGRNVTLFEQARACGWYIAGAGLDETTAVDALFTAAKDLREDEGDRSVMSTIRSGLRSGTKYPKAVPLTAGQQQAADLAAKREAVADLPPVTLDEAHAVFCRWLGDDYDLDALDAVLATAVVERMTGDPLWLLLVSGSGNAKTETVQALTGAGALVTSTISSAGALLSATSNKEKSKDATGGLLRKMGDRGVLVIKDVTSILSMNRDSRAEVLAAIREVYDGQWSRNVGTDGGKTLDWTGRLAVVGAVTTAWDKAHAVIASMGDRFVLVRMDSTVGRQAAARQAIRNVGHEVQMRVELSDAAAGVVAGADLAAEPVTDEEMEVLTKAANLVTLARTAVEYDHRGDVVDAHAPEMPTRFAKQLSQVLHGAVAIGHSRDSALRLAIRCARDSMPPLRLAILDDVAAHPASNTADVRKRLGLPRATVDRQLQALQILGLLDVDEEAGTWAGREATRWTYTVSASDEVDPAAIDLNQYQKCQYTPLTPNEGERETDAEPPAVPPPSDISGTDPGTAERGTCRDCGAATRAPGHIRCDACQGLTMAAIRRAMQEVTA